MTKIIIAAVTNVIILNTPASNDWNKVDTKQLSNAPYEVVLLQQLKDATADALKALKQLREEREALDVERNRREAILPYSTNGLIRLPYYFLPNDHISVILTNNFLNLTGGK